MKIGIIPRGIKSSREVSHVSTIWLQKSKYHIGEKKENKR